MANQSSGPQFPFGNAEMLQQMAAAWSQFTPERMSEHMTKMFGQMPMGQMPNFAQMPNFGQMPSFDPAALMQQWQGAFKPGANPMMGLDAIKPMLQGLNVQIAPEKLAKLQSEFSSEWMELMAAAAPGPHAKEHLGQRAAKDRRFASDNWKGNEAFSFTAAAYLLNAKYLTRMAEQVEGDEKTRNRVKFAVSQFVDAMAPSNFLAFNPDAQKRLIETKGESLKVGIENLLGDLVKGKISQTDESAFEVGKNVATTEGAVVFENPLFQLIQYKPTTETVGSRPILMVPPCINKYYIMDLQPDNSLVGYTVSQGNTVFLVSWKNVHADQGTLTWDDYIEEGAIKAIDVVREISKQDKINVLGFCVGGTITTTALAVLNARGIDCVESLTLLTTLLDFSDTGILDVFVDEAHVQMREQTLGRGGLMPGRDLANAFSSLRPNDLVWNYVVANYLKGERPPAFDLLFWNGDSTNLPGPMYCWYLRNTYLEDNLKKPGKCTVAGSPVDLSSVDVPAFVYASREDHIVPWQAAYRGGKLLGGDVKFVLGASGHIAGVINPASKNKRNFWVNDERPAEPQAWFDTAEDKPGSWWSTWATWLAQHQGKQVKAPKSYGNAKFKAIEPAPGRYVKERA